jgi:hypothetical protein
MIVAVGLALAMSAPVALLAAPDDPMPESQQTAMVQTYCVACHNDSARNGGLSLQHFDASKVDPSLAAMMVSKVRGGALGASGLPAPEPAVRRALVLALTARASRAHEWNVSQSEGTRQPVVTAGIARHLPSGRNAGEPSVYRLVLSCNVESHEGDMQLSWAPTATNGTVNVSLDGKAPLTFLVEGGEKMGNGLGAAMGPAAITFFDTRGATQLPVRTLTISNLFPDETVVFPFAELPQQARVSLSGCFTGSKVERFN